MFFLLSQAPASNVLKSDVLKVKAKSIYLADFDSLDVILDYHADEPMVPSSMTKIMTALVCFQALRDKKISPDTTVTVPSYAYKTEGTTMFLNLNQVVSIEDLLRGLICVSGNDAAKTLAIALEGSEEAFAVKMTEMAKKIGATHTNFENASGLPSTKHQTTARDLFKISHYLISHFKKEYQLFKEKSFCFNQITQYNKNTLLNHSSFDGIKTGFTQLGKYGMVASRVDPISKRRLILVINGLSSERERAEEAKRLLQWGFRQTKNIYFFQAGQTVAQRPVRFGDKRMIDLVTYRSVCVTVEADEKEKPTCDVFFNAPYIKGPLPKGSVVGKVIVKTKWGRKVYDLRTKEEIKQASLLWKIIDSFKF